MTDSNPYRTPETETTRIHESTPVQEPYEQGKVSAAATSLIIVAAVSLLFFLGAAAVGLAMLVSGVAAELPTREGALIDRETSIVIRLCFSAVIVMCQFVILIGAINMKKMRNLQLATVAAILSCVPCVSPCYFLGIPFGIWALTVLGDPEVKEAFE